MTPDCEERPPRSPCASPDNHLEDPSRAPPDDIYGFYCKKCKKTFTFKAVLDSIRRLGRVDSTGLAKEKEKEWMDDWTIRLPKDTEEHSQEQATTKE